MTLHNIILPLVGMPETVLKRATTKSAEIESRENTKLTNYEEKLFLKALQLLRGPFSSDQQEDIAAFVNIREEWRTM